MAEVEYANLRHPELVSRSIAPHGPPYRFQPQPDREIGPMRIIGIDKVYLPWSVPILPLLFASNGRRHISKHLIMDKAINRIFRSMTRGKIVTVLIHALRQVRRHANISRPVQLVCKDIGAGLFFLKRHGQRFTVKWTLKQVQGDEMGIIRQAQLMQDDFLRAVR